MAAEIVRNPAVRSGLDVRPAGATVIVRAGEFAIGGRIVRLEEDATLPVKPAPDVEVRDEALRLSADKPEGWWRGTRLKGPDAQDINARDSLVPGSVVVRKGAGGDPLILNEDYRVAEQHAMIGVGPGSAVKTEDAVRVSYRYSQMRMDAVDAGPDGRVELTEGTPHVRTPNPPALRDGRLRLACIFRPYRSTTVEEEHVFPVLEEAANVSTGTTSGLIPKTTAKLKSGGPVRIVCWGDSVTAGGNASRHDRRYVDVFAAGLRERFPEAKTDVVNVSVGGSNSRQWLCPKEHPTNNPAIDFSRVIRAKPDLVTIEFVNDASMDEATVRSVYGDILARLERIGAECILITPHFTHPAWMGFKSMREMEKRPYVLAIRKFAADRKLALADAAARWEHLWKEGIPFLTLLDNSVNHPDDRGHRMFAEELLKCFAP